MVKLFHLYSAKEEEKEQERVSDNQPAAGKENLSGS